MSFVIDDDQQDPNEEQKKDDSQEGVVSLAGSGGDVASAGSPETASSATPSASKPSKSGSWTNLQSYLDANADQGAKVGSQIAGTVSNQASTAKDDVDSAANEFKKSVDENTVNANPDAVKHSIDSALNLHSGETYNPDDLTAYQKQANAAYNGPTDFTKGASYGRAQQDVTKAQTSLGQLGSEAGRDVLLQDQYRNASANGYNQGEQNLDQLLLEGNPDNQKAFQGVKDQWSGIGNALSSAATQGNAQAQGAIATNQATSKAAKDALAGASSQFNSGLDQETQAAQAKAEADYNATLDRINSHKFNNYDMEQLGIQPGQSLFHVNLGDYVKQGAPATAETVASPDEYARYAALSKLAGVEPSLLTDPTKSHTFTPYTINSAKDAVASQSAAYNAARDVKNNTTLGGDPQSINDLVAFVQKFGGPNGISADGEQADPAALAAANKAINDFDNSWGEGNFVEPYKNVDIHKPVIGNNPRFNI